MGKIILFHLYLLKKRRSEWDVAVVVAQYSLILQDPEENRIQARTFYINPEYNETYRTNDLALIKLNQPITYGLYVNFSYYDEVNDTYTSAEVMGWGAIMVNLSNRVCITKQKIHNRIIIMSRMADPHLRNYEKPL